MIAIKLPDLNDFIVSVILDGKPWRLHLSWNESAGWSMGIRDGNDTALLYGVRCVPNYPLIYRYRRPYLPKGEFICTLPDDKQSRIERGDFASGRAVLMYLSEAEAYGAV